MNTSQEQLAITGFMLPENPKKAMKAVIEVIEELIGLYEAETEALETTNPQGFMALQDAKLQTAGKYENGVAQILARKDEMKSVEPGLKTRLRELQDHFSTLCHKNLKALERMQNCTERLGNIIRNAARDAVKKERALSYGQNGTLDNSDKKSVSMGLSETA